MVLNNWTSPYAAPIVSGVTGGTLSVPTLVPLDWNIVSREPQLVVYRTTNSDLLSTAIAAELSIGVSNRDNPYNAKDMVRKVPLGLQAPGLQSHVVYSKVTLFGQAEDDASSAAFVVPLRTSISIEIPQGVDVTKANLINCMQINLSALCDAITAGTVDIFSHVADISGGSIEIR